MRQNEDNSAGFAVYDDEGRPRGALGTSARGEPELLFWDEEGRRISPPATTSLGDLTATAFGSADLAGADLTELRAILQTLSLLTP